MANLERKRFTAAEIEKIKSDADSGKPIAEFEYGVILLKGLGIKPSKEEALIYFAKCKVHASFDITRNLSHIYDEIGIEEESLDCRKRSLKDYKDYLGLD
ncbi:MAG: SEL1-like repeat protein [Bacilli bacterium]|nr:SEL1-like repeat protein [Bacilli bacterium]